MSYPQKEKWLLWLDKAHLPALNMAIDEELLFESAKINIPFLRFYSWSSKAMSIGYIQTYEKTFKNGYDLVRRPTGGGVVFHDIDLTYTVVIPSGHYIERLSREESYHIVHRTIINAISSLGLTGELVENSHVSKERQEMICFTAPVKFDIAIQKGNVSSKIAGAAQRRTRQGILHQGSIVLEDMDRIRDNLIKLISKSFRTELSVDFLEFTPGKDFMERAELLSKTKYSKDNWNKLR